MTYQYILYKGISVIPGSDGLEDEPINPLTKEYYDCIQIGSAWYTFAKKIAGPDFKGTSWNTFESIVISAMPYGFKDMVMSRNHRPYVLESFDNESFLFRMFWALSPDELHDVRVSLENYLAVSSNVAHESIRIMLALNDLSNKVNDYVFGEDAFVYG